MIDRTRTAAYTEWLRQLATAGGKGVVNNVDARALGRIADRLENLGDSNDA